MKRQNETALAAAVLCTTLACVSPGRAADCLPPDTARALANAEKSSDSAAFRALLRRAIAAAPQRREAILRAAMRAYPEQSAALLMDGLQASTPRADPNEDETAAAVAPPAPATGMYTAAPRDVDESVASATPRDAPEETSAWSGSVVLGATVRTGNTDNAGVSGESSLRYDADRWHHRGKAAGDYLRNRTETQEQSFEGEYEARYDLDRRNFTYGLARYEEDRFSGFDYEFTSSAGLGRHLAKEEGHEWTVTLGPSFRVAQRRDSESPEESVGARFTNLLSWELSQSAKVENETEALADSEEVRVNNDVALKVRLVEQLSAQLSFGIEYRSEAPEDAEHTDTTTRAAIVYDF